MANPRHAHEHRVLARLACRATGSIVAGVIDTTTNYVEHPEVVAERIELAARAVGDPHRVLAGTDCGFDTSTGWARSPRRWCGRSCARCAPVRRSPRADCFSLGSLPGAS